MKLFFNKPSPYARIVRIVAHEKQLIERIEMRDVDPWSDPPELLAATPLSKVPALVTDDGLLITESGTISLFLDTIGDGPKLAPEGWEPQARAALAHGLIDAAFITVIERRRPQDRQWPDWCDRQRRAIDRTLNVVTVRRGRFDLGDITLAAALAYLDFRLPEIAWRDAHPDLAQWLDAVNQRPSMRATTP